MGWRCSRHSCGLTFAFFIMRQKGTRRCAELGRGYGKRHASRYGNAGTCAQRFVVAEAIVQKRSNYSKQKPKCLFPVFMLSMTLPTTGTLEEGTPTSRA